MVRVAVFSASALLLALEASAACNYLSDRSVVFADNTKPVCEDMLDTISALKIKKLDWFKTKATVDGPKKNYQGQ